jgi:hypothetical protein
MNEQGPLEGPLSQCLDLPGLSVHRVGAAESTVLLELESILSVRLVLGCDVVPPLALRAGERQRRSLVRRHCLTRFGWVRGASPTC